MIEFKIIRSDKLSNSNSMRYIVVDNLGTILDDANGFGYKTINKAKNSYLMKLKQGKKQFLIKGKSQSMGGQNNCMESEEKADFF